MKLVFLLVIMFNHQVEVKQGKFKEGECFSLNLDEDKNRETALELVKTGVCKPITETEYNEIKVKADEKAAQDAQRELLLKQQDDALLIPDESKGKNKNKTVTPE